jgi:hypothetical protein
MSARTFTRLTRIDRRKAGVQLQMLYNAVKKTSVITSEEARGSLLAQIEDLVETIGVDWSHGAPALTDRVCEAAFGRHVRAFHGTTDEGGAR